MCGGQKLWGGLICVLAQGVMEKVLREQEPILTQWCVNVPVDLSVFFNLRTIDSIRMHSQKPCWNSQLCPSYIDVLLPVFHRINQLIFKLYHIATYHDSKTPNCLTG